MILKIFLWLLYTAVIFAMGIFFGVLFTFGMALTETGGIG